MVKNKYVKIITNNYLSLLVKIAVTSKYFYTSNFSHIMVSNVGTFVDVDRIMEQITDYDTCMGRLVDYRFRGLPIICIYTHNW